MGPNENGKWTTAPCCGGAAVPECSAVELEQKKRKRFNADDMSAPPAAGNLLKAETSSSAERIESGVSGAGHHGTPSSHGTTIVAQPAETTVYRPDAGLKATAGE